MAGCRERGRDTTELLVFEHGTFRMQDEVAECRCQLVRIGQEAAVSSLSVRGGARAVLRCSSSRTLRDIELITWFCSVPYNLVFPRSNFSPDTAPPRTDL